MDQVVLFHDHLRIGTRRLFIDLKIQTLRVHLRLIGYYSQDLCLATP